MNGFLLNYGNSRTHEYTGNPVQGSSVIIGRKIKAVRVAEGLSQPKMSQLIDIPVGSLRDWEQERGILGLTI